MGAYARAALTNARADLLAASEGQRDNTLWMVACSLMELVKARAVGRAAVETDLREAALIMGSRSASSPTSCGVRMIMLRHVTFPVCKSR